MHTDLQTVLRRFLDDYRQAHRLSPREAEVCRHILGCRTASMGGVERCCDRCGHCRIDYCACRDRHCPKCQWRASDAWVERQCAHLLPVTYYHVVFTLPHELNPWVARHPARLYRAWFEAVWATLKAFGADPKRLGGQLGATLVLHTWGQQLWRHVHIHCLIPGGAIDPAGHWHAARSSYLFPNQALARQVRGKLVSLLRQAWQHGELPRLADGAAVDTTLDSVMAKDWVVYTKPWLQRAQTVLEYLARYSFRTALSDARLAGIEGDNVGLRYKDYADDNRWKTLPLHGEELIRRFLLHVLPKGLMRIRHYGFLANRCRSAKLAKVRAALRSPAPPKRAAEGDNARLRDDWPCPQCHRGQLRPIMTLAPRWAGSG